MLIKRATSNVASCVFWPSKRASPLIPRLDFSFGIEIEMKRDVFVVKDIIFVINKRKISLDWIWMKEIESEII